MVTRALLAIVVAAPVAHAEGEHGPMIGGSIVGAHDDEASVAGVGGEIALWAGPIGVGLEVQRRWAMEDSRGPHVTSLAGSLRVLVLRAIVPSLLDAREVVELGGELQLIAERGWWTTEDDSRDSMQYGLGAALRLRGATDDDRSNLLAESRVFVRVLGERGTSGEATAKRGTVLEERRGTTVMIGLGVLWGGGKPAYVARLRRDNSLDSEAIVSRR